MNARLLFVHVLSPLHPGTGQGTGVIDLPVAREKATGLPYLPGSSLKGVLRDACGEDEVCVRVFGPDPDRASDHAGSAQFSDQRLLLLPTRSLKGTFAWATSPYILKRFVRDAQIAGVEGLPSTIPSPPDRSSCIVCQEKREITVKERGEEKVVLEDLDLVAVPRSKACDWAKWIGEQVFPDDPEWQGMLISRFCVVSDDVMDFLLQTATEITARIRLQKDAKTVERGGLWYEEALPTETVLYGLLVATPVMASPEEVFETVEKLAQKPLQFGGNATTGKGLCRLVAKGGG